MDLCCCFLGKPALDRDDQSTDSSESPSAVIRVLSIQHPPSQGTRASVTSQQLARTCLGKSTDSIYDTIQSASAVKVAVVVRPLLPFEQARTAVDIVSVNPPHKVTLNNKTAVVGSPGQQGSSFDFDRVYKAEGLDSDKRLFMECIQPLLEQFCQGFNATVFAYGQTGSGKTHTMGTTASLEDITTKDVRRVIPRSMQYMFKHATAVSRNYTVVIKAMYYEIYNEEIRDLLDSTPRGHVRTAAALDRSPSIRERNNGDVYVEGVTEVEVSSLQQVAALLEQGNGNRAVGAHKQNEHSSRSHAILTLVMEQRARSKPAEPVPADLRYLRSKLHLVDLAGSERAKATGATGQRFTEGININRSLLELGNVINALAEGTKHIPYRNSKLTRVLRDSLGGNSETLMVACCSPADDNYDNTQATLRYASRARNIKNSLRLNNQLSIDEELSHLRKLVNDQAVELDQLRKELKVRSV